MEHREEELEPHVLSQSCEIVIIPAEVWWDGSETLRCCDGGIQALEKRWVGKIRRGMPSV